MCKLHAILYVEAASVQMFAWPICKMGKSLRSVQNTRPAVLCLYISVAAAQTCAKLADCTLFQRDLCPRACAHVLAGAHPFSSHLTAANAWYFTPWLRFFTCAHMLRWLRVLQAAAARFCEAPALRSSCAVAQGDALSSLAACCTVERAVAKHTWLLVECLAFLLCPELSRKCRGTRKLEV